jgi:RNA-splicing ligase RtcB
MPHTELTERQRQVLGSQFGTLGSGNHFVEVCLDLDNRVWTVLHSGSRGIGNQLASAHIKLAKAQGQALEDKDLAYFLEGTPEFQAYIRDMVWAQEYAYGNRQVMANHLNEAVLDACGRDSMRLDLAILDAINCHHNFTARESFDGRLLWVTRKGAIRAYSGDRGVIPGSMGARTYIVKGKGVQAAWCSCAHGAGRKMSRSQAKRELTGASLAEAMTGRTWNDDRAATLVDEHPKAYKPIDQIMADQSDLVTVQEELRQILNYKG